MVINKHHSTNLDQTVDEFTIKQKQKESKNDANVDRQKKEDVEQKVKNVQHFFSVHVPQQLCF